jgi:hypothetical protein
MPRYAARFLDPKGCHHGGIPTYPWRFAPDGLATRRQLRALGLCPGGQAPVAQLMWRRRRGQTGVAYLYDLATARPKRTAGPAVRAALGKALEARQTCSTCREVRGYVIPRRYGECLDCAGICPATGDACRRMTSTRVVPNRQLAAHPSGQPTTGRRGSE